MTGDSPTVGVEQEFLTVDSDGFELRPLAHRIRWASHRTMGDVVQHELSLAQIEIATPVCSTLDEVEVELRRGRIALSDAASTQGAAIASTGTHPNGDWMDQAITPMARFLEMEEDYQQLAREQLICGCHVHVAIDDPDLMIRVMDTIRPQVPVLLALAANSPFWMGVDTGYASFRTQIFDRWPTAGPPPVCRDRLGYERHVDRLIDIGLIPDSTYLYWHLRPSSHYPTLELRVTDACLTTEETTMIAALFRSLVRTAIARDREVHDPPSQVLLRAAVWAASRYGLDGPSFDLLVGDRAPAPIVVRRLLTRQRADLELHGEWDRVHAIVDAVLRRGNGAHRQRVAVRTTGCLDEVTRMIVDSTRDGRLDPFRDAEGASA